MDTLDDSVLRRFWRSVQKTADCWLWTGTKAGAGYGSFRYHGIRMYAHRFSYMLHIGPIPDGLFVLHQCDTPACIHPDHLFLGTQRDNIADMMQKGRHIFQQHPERHASGDQNGARRHPERLARGDHHWSHIHPERRVRGSQQGASKLTENNVRAILQRVRAAQGTRGIGVQLAREFGVTPGLIYHIIHGKAWTHVRE